MQLHADGAEEAVLLGKKRRAGPRKKDADVQHKSEVSESEKRAPDNEADGGSDEEDSEWEERQDDERDERMQADFSRGGKKKRRIMARIDTDSPWICDHCTRRFKSVSRLSQLVSEAGLTRHPYRMLLSTRTSHRRMQLRMPPRANRCHRRSCQSEPTRLTHLAGVVRVPPLHPHCSIC